MKQRLSIMVLALAIGLSFTAVAPHARASNNQATTIVQQPSLFVLTPANFKESISASDKPVIVLVSDSASTTCKQGNDLLRAQAGKHPEATFAKADAAAFSMPADKAPGLFVFTPGFGVHATFHQFAFDACASADFDAFISERIESATKLAAAQKRVHDLSAKVRPLEEKFKQLYLNPDDSQREQRIWVGEQLAGLLKAISNQQQLIADTLHAEDVAAGLVAK